MSFKTLTSTAALIFYGFGGGLLFSQGEDARPAPQTQERASPQRSGGGEGSVSAVSSNYVLKASDVIQVSIFNEPDLMKSVRIELDGSISLPLVGRIRVGEMTVAEAQELITQLYDRDFVVNPQVSVLVIEFSSATVRVLGAVGAPGIIPIPHDRPLMLTDAITQVRDISRIGNRRNVQIRRVSDDGTTQVMEVDFDQIVTDPNSRDIPLRDGDTIFVRERRI